MADLQISQLPTLAEADLAAGDELAVVDGSASETKRITAKALVEKGVALIDAGSIPGSALGSLGTNTVITTSILDGNVTNAKLANSSFSFGGLTISLGSTDDTPALDLTDATNYPASSLSGTVSNAQLGGSIANNKLANSSISLAGVSIDLGETIATPTFDLTNATNYPASSLTGTVSNAQLSGSIANSKLVNSSINIGGVSLSLGDTDSSPAFDLSDATNYPTSALSGTITNAQLAGSIQGSKILAGSISSTELGTNSVTAIELANLSVDTAALIDLSVTDSKISAVSGTKITAGSLPATAINASNLGTGLAISSNNLVINNTVAAGSAAKVTFSSVGLITGSASLAASDLPIADATNVGGVSIGGGLSVTGAGALSLSNSISAATVSGFQFNAFGQIVSATNLVSGDLPLSTTSQVGGVQITSGGGLSVDGSGGLSTSTSGISAGTYTKLTVNTKGVATAGQLLVAGDIPDIPATKLTTGVLDAGRIGAGTIDSSKLSDSSTAIIQSIAQLGFPTAGVFTGQLLFDPIAEDAYLWDGNAWNPITTLTKGALQRFGTYDANLSQVDSVTSAGAAAGLSIGANLPVASESVDGGYVVISVQGTPSGVAGITGQLSPPDYLLGVTNTGGSSWQEIDLSSTVASQVASQIGYTPFGQISSNNVQSAIDELETEKLAKSGGEVTGELLIGATGSLVFEGSTADAFETKLVAQDPSVSDKILTLPNITGTLITTGDTDTVTSTMVDGSLTNTNLAANAAIAFTKLASLTAASILVGNASNEVAGVPVTGDISIDNAGLTAIGAGKIVNSMVSGTAAIDGSKVTAASTSAAGTVQLNDSTNSTSTSEAATANALKTAYDLATTANTAAAAAFQTTGGSITGDVTLANAKELRFSEASGDGSNYTAFKAQAQSSDITYSWPSTSPSGGQVLKASVSTPTTLEWATDTTNTAAASLTGTTLASNVVTSSLTSVGTLTSLTVSGTITGDVSGSLTGNADTATALASSVNIGGVAFDGSTSINLPGVNATGDQDTTGTSGGFTAGNATNLNSGTVSASLLGSGSSISTKFLRGDNTWQTVTGTTINNNADNRIITGSSSANTLEGESNLTFDGSELKLPTGSGTEGLFFQASSGANANLRGVGTNYGSLGFFFGNTEKVRFDSSGKVGIGGTTSFTELLDVSSTGASTAIEISAGEASTTTGEAKLVLRSLHSSSGTGYSRSEIASLGVAGGDSDLIFRTTTDNNGPQERMRIDSSGKVGIGVTPLKALHVKSTGAVLRLETTATTGSNYIDFNDADEGKAWIGLGSGSDDSLSIWNIKSDSVRIATNNLERMRIDSAGRVGIGESSSIDARLHVNSGTDNATLFLESTDGDVNLCMADDAGSCRLLQAGGALAFRTGGNANAFGTGDNERMRIDSSGKLLLGQNNDNDGQLCMAGVLAFSAGGSGTASTSNARPNISRGADGQLILAGGKDSGSSIRFDVAANGSTNAGEVGRFDASGRLLIGTNTPTHTLGLQAEIKLADNTVYDATVNRVHGLLIHNDSDVDGGFAGLELRATDAQGYVGSVLLKAIADGADYSNDFVIQTRHGGTYAERLRINSIGAFGIAGSNYGTSGQVLTSGGSSAAPSWADAGGGSEISGTASGSIAQDKACIVKTDGNIAEVVKSVTQQTPAFSDEQEWNGSQDLDYGGGTVIWIEELSCYVAGWWDRNSSNQNFYRARIGIQGSGKDINWGSTVHAIADSNQQTPIAMGYDPSSGYLIYMATNSSGSSQQYIRSYKPQPDFSNVNNSSMAFGDAFDIANNAYEPKAVVYDATAEKLVVFIDSYARVLECSSTGSLSWPSGSSAVGQTQGTALRQAKYFPEMGRIGMLSNANSESLYFQTITVNSDNSITNNTQVQLEDGVNDSSNGKPCNVISYDWTWDTSISRIVLTYVIHDGVNFGKTSFRVGNLASNGNVSWTNRATLIDYSGSGNAAIYSSGSHALIYEPNVGRLCLAFYDGGDSGKMKALKWNATTSGGTANVGTETTLKSEGSPKQVIYKSDLKYIVISFTIPGSPRREGKSAAIVLGTATTNMTAANFVGFAKAAATNGNSVDIKVVGNTSTQSSLTAGSKHYVQMDGTLGTSADTPSVEAGLALSSTSLLIK